MTKKYFIVLSAVLGFFLNPSTVLADGNKSASECCSSAMSAKNEKKCGCEKSTEQNQNKGCQGKCNTLSCTITMVYVAIPSMSYVDFENVILRFTSESTHNYAHSKAYLSSDFKSIWLPPKIG